MHCGARLSCSGCVKQHAWEVLPPHVFWQLELVVNHSSSGKGKHLFPYASRLSLFQKSTLAKQTAWAPLTVCKLITLSYFFVCVFLCVCLFEMSLGPNLNDSHMISAGGFQKQRRVPFSLLFICQTVCSCPPQGFPSWQRKARQMQDG